MKKSYLLFFLLTNFYFSYSQTTVTLTADRDNTMYSESNTSNGAGQNFFAGITAQGNKRRALLHFNLSSIPAGSVINSATLTIYVNKLAASAAGIVLAKAAANWGEGTSDATANEGTGASASTGDATWSNSFYPSTSWSASGGDFSSTTATVATVSFGAVSINNATLKSDVQSFVNSSASNFGWMIMGSSEGSTSTAIRFASRENPSTSQRPQLTINYTASSLPITLKSFSASLQSNSAYLRWQTASETNFKYFDVEHSNDGTNFSSIARINGNGNSTGTRSYSYTDNSIGAGKHYYRLAYYDFDGSVHFSQVILLSSKSNLQLQLYPNPALSYVKLITSTSLDRATFSITNLGGQIVNRGVLTTQQISVDQLSGGQYWLTVQTETGEMLRTSFIKK